MASTSRQKHLFEDYDGFVEKFKPKKTTDDCYTPPDVYDCVSDWACERFGIDPSGIVRPFWPGGDYESFDYPEGCTVRDNPPFSILSKICEFYLDRGIGFFLFAPALTALSGAKTCMRTNHVFADCDIEYHNGAVVRTSFVTSFGDNVAETAPDLFRLSLIHIYLEEVEREAAKDVVEERERALAEQLESMRKRKRKLVDPLQFEMSIASEDLTGYVPQFAWEMAPASDAQKAALEKAGICPDEIGCAGKASLLMDKIAKRRAEGLATPKQIRQLEGRGFRRVGEWTMDQASALISRIAANGWRTPASIDPATYEPSREARAARVPTLRLGA